MAGISSNALKGMNYAENRIKYNGKELQNKEFGDGAGLKWYDYGARFYDVQIGRWIVHDPKLQYASPYVAMGNRPVNGVDFDGKWFGAKVAKNAETVGKALDYAETSVGFADDAGALDGIK